MQFIKDGPDIPERLLQAHEAGDVVFFCGAGISYAAGLPEFKGLVKKLYSNLKVTPDANQKAAIRNKHYDYAITQLDAHKSIGRKAVRRAIKTILQPDLSQDHATTVHEALLILGRGRDGHTRLITTNFDRLFEHVIDDKNLSIKRHKAPLLPVPKNRWDGLVYLHGLLPETEHDNDLEDLVVSSGDFGLAYLTERWATRFVSALLQRFTVCFIGYSLEDPVMRYMMDALAADRLLGETSREMFAFGSFSRGKEAICADEWKAKNITPILYREKNKHIYLRKTLEEWSSTYRDGVHGQRSIVRQYATLNPSSILDDDMVLNRMFWAFSDRSGGHAQTFATLNPAPPLEWLDPFSDNRFGHTDLIRFGVPPKAKVNDELKFSLLHRPAPYDLAPRMALVDWNPPFGRFDDVMKAMAKWLIRHLDKVDLLLWCINRGGRLHPEFAVQIRRRLAEIQMENADDPSIETKTELSDAIPCPAMQILWKLFLSGHVKRNNASYFCRNMRDWIKDFEREGLTPVLRMELRDLLRLRIKVRKPFQFFRNPQSKPNDPPTIRDLVDTNLEPTTENATNILTKPKNRNRQVWIKALPALLGDFTSLLRDSMDLQRMLGRADDQRDSSYTARPSISDHEQNFDVDNWTVVITLARDAWIAATDQSADHGRRVAEDWLHTPYPVFKRLAFFAAAYGTIIPARQGLEWLLTDDEHWLWSVETHRETLRLLVALAPRLDADGQTTLQSAILKGPPRTMYKTGLDDKRWTLIVDRDVWLRLKKLQDAGASLNTCAHRCLEKLSAKYPDWTLSTNDRDEFLIWSGGPEDMVAPARAMLPHDPDDLAEWLRIHPEPDDYWRPKYDWRTYCQHNPKIAATTLTTVAKDPFWPALRWSEAFDAWSRDDLPKQTWQHVHAILTDMPHATLHEVARGLSFWLEALALEIDDKETTTYLALCDRILELESEKEEENMAPVNQAINHPMGRITTALLRRWYHTKPENNAGLTDETRQRFTRLCTPDICRERHGRVVLAHHVISLFQVDPEWTQHYLLPFFDWAHPENAAGMWQAFLHSPRLHPPLLAALKPDFLATAKHCDHLGHHQDEYARFLTFSALDLNTGNIFSKPELKRAFATLPSEELATVADALFCAVNNADDQSASYWTHRVTPFLRNIWPQSTDGMPPEIAESFALACVAAGNAFPNALNQVKEWLRPLSWGSYQITDNILETTPSLIQRHPEEVLVLLDMIIGEQSQTSSKLEQCLIDIQSEKPDLKSDPRFERLQGMVRQD